MLPMQLRHGRWYCLGHCSDIEQKWQATLLIQVFTPGMPAKFTQVQLRRHVGSRALRWL